MLAFIVKHLIAAPCQASCDADRITSHSNTYTIIHEFTIQAICDIISKPFYEVRIVSMSALLGTIDASASSYTFTAVANMKLFISHQHFALNGLSPSAHPSNILSNTQQAACFDAMTPCAAHISRHRRSCVLHELAGPPACYLAAPFR